MTTFPRLQEVSCPYCDHQRQCCRCQQRRRVLITLEAPLALWDVPDCDCETCTSLRALRLRTDTSQVPRKRRR